MNSLWENNKYLTEHYLDSFSTDLDQIFLPGFMLSFRIYFSCYHHLFIFSFLEVFLLVELGISAVTKNITALWQIEAHILQSVNVMKTAWKYCKFNWDSIFLGNHLDGKTIKVFSQRSLVAYELFSFDNSRTRDTYFRKQVQGNCQ